VVASLPTRMRHDINRVEELSYDLKIQEVMTVKSYSTASPEMSLSEVLEYCASTASPAFPLLEDGELVGVISIEDIVRAMEKNDLTETVGQYMTRNLITVASYDTIVKAMQTFRRKQCWPPAGYGRK
jgi:predicted transcriptional regulator